MLNVVAVMNTGDYITLAYNKTLLQLQFATSYINVKLLLKHTANISLRLSYFNTCAVVKTIGP